MYSFQPDPDPAELDALVAALEGLLGGEGGQSGPYRSAWRRTALEEGVSPAEADDLSYREL